MNITEGRQTITSEHSVLSPLPLSIDYTTLASLNLSEVVKCLEQMVQLTLPSEDLHGRVSQLLVTSHHELLGITLDQEGTLTIIPGGNIINPLDLNDTQNNLIHRLDSFHPKKWNFVFDVHRFILTIWPQIKAAGKYDNMDVQEILKDGKKRFNKVKNVYLIRNDEKRG